MAEADNQIVGNVMYSKAKVVDCDGGETEVLTFGPLSVLPMYWHKGVGSALMGHSIKEAKRLGYKAIIFYGHPDYYPRFGFRNAKVYGITTQDGKNFDALMAMPLYDGALDGVSGVFHEDEAFNVNAIAAEKYDKFFPHKEPAEMLPIDVLLEQLEPTARKAFTERDIKTLAWLQRLSGREMLQWEGIDERVMGVINRTLSKFGYAKKLLPSSPIFLQAETTKLQVLSLRDHPERMDECWKLLLEHFNEFASKHPSEVLSSTEPLPQGYFMLKNDRVIGWTGLHKHEVVSGKVYGWEGTIKQDEILSENLSPWITPLLVHPDERRNHYGKMLLEYARKDAGRLGFKVVYLTTNHIGYYEKYGFREVGLTMFTWGHPTKIYEHNTTLI